MPTSKEQIAAYRKEYRKKNKEQIAAYGKKYYEKNKEQIAVYGKEYYEKNKKQLVSKAKEYNKLNKEKIAARHKEYNEKNKEQVAATRKEWYRKNRVDILEDQRKNYKSKKQQIKCTIREKKYGVSAEDYDTMLEEQDNKCKICFVSFTTLSSQQIHVDHCHTTNQVRGLLCNLCNTGLGFFKDNTETLANAIVYLEHTQEEQDETN
jgi:hypothetical protein